MFEIKGKVTTAVCYGKVVEIVDIMKPVYNFKASDDQLPWKKDKAAEAARR